MRVDNDQVSSGIWVILGLIISLGSLQYGLGSLESPGTGFMPFLAGLAITLLSLIGFSQGVFKRQERSWKPILQGVDWPKTAIVVGALFGFTLLMKPLGFSLATALFIAFLMRAVQPQRWPVVIVGAVGTALGAYGIFELWLKAQLPRGPWGF